MSSQHDFCIYTSIALEQAKNYVFTTRIMGSYAFDPTSVKITFIHLNIAFHHSASQ